MQKWQLTIFLFSRNVARIDFINSLSGGTFPSCFFAFTRTSNKTIDTTHKTGIAQNGRNHTMAAREQTLK